LLFITPAHAEGYQVGIVTEVITRASDGLVYFFMSGPITGTRPPCATIGYWMIKDENSAAGKRQLATLLIARTTGQPIKVSGAGVCTRWGDGEDVNIIAF
jgi:hypothetical protein